MDGIAKICRNNKTIRICNRDRYVIGIDTNHSRIPAIAVYGSMFYLFTNVRDKKRKKKKKKKRNSTSEEFFYLSTIVEIDN